MKIDVWGCRGSIPSPGPESIKYGGNTSCVQVSHGDTCIVLDGGSGIQRLGHYLNARGKEVHILLTHLHIDHTMGLGFFLPLYDPNVTIHLWGPASSGESLLQRLRRYFSPPLFPVRLNELPMHPVIHELHDGDFQIGEIAVKANYLCHPSPTMGYRLEAGGSSFAYIPDHEIAIGAPNFPNEPEWTSGYDLVKDVDLLLHDAQYTRKEYDDRVGWGHSAMEHTIRYADFCRVKRLAMFHHDPGRTDHELDALLADLKGRFDLPLELGMCAEGDSFIL